MSGSAARFFRPEERPPPAGGVFQALDPEPPLLDIAGFSQLAVNCAAAGASDLTLQTDQSVLCQMGGRHLVAFRRALTDAEIKELAGELYGNPAAASLLAGQQVLDFSWEVVESRIARRRFRVNATPILARRGGDGAELSLRTLPDRTPSVSKVGLGAALAARLSPRSGLVIVAGATNQGKSTTLAALLGQRLAGGDVKIVDIQAPIEFTFSDLRAGQEAGAASIGQSEVGVHVRDFAAGVRSALRRSPDIVVIGEVRDGETARAAVDAALTGHLVYTTLHAGDVPEIFRRLLALLTADSGSAATAAVDILQTLRVGMAQRLLRSRRGYDRYPIRETAILDGGVRRRLQGMDPNAWSAAMAEALATAAPGDPLLRPFDADVRALLADGRIDRETAAPWLGEAE